MSNSDQAMMLGIRHKCGQEIQFWIPVNMIASIIGEVDESELTGLAVWMQEQGLAGDSEIKGHKALVEELRRKLEPRQVAFINVEEDNSVCPSCGSLIRWLEAVTHYAHLRRENG